MRNPLAVESLNQSTARSINSRWAGVLTTEKPIDLTTFQCRLIAGAERSKKLYLRYEPNASTPSYADRAGCGVIFDGVLYDRPRWQRELTESSVNDLSSDAEIVLAAYEKSGDQVFSRLRGTFALVVWDSRNETLKCLRDPTGFYSLFYCETGEDILVSTTMDVLIRQPKVSAALNTEALSDFFLDRFPMMEETFFANVKRVPPGHMLRITRDRRDSYRYWDPAPNGVVEWLRAEELEQFDDLLSQAVSRPFGLGPSGILLSGGFDSVSVAAGAAECAETSGGPKPLALSLIFPEADVNEEV